MPLRTLAFISFLGMTSACFATEPLFDSILIDEEQGTFYPEKSNPQLLPNTEKLWEARRKENCSAIGGPVGRFKLANNKLWLTGLHRCGGDFPLHDIYPELEAPAFADWVDGVYIAKRGWLCRGEDYSHRFRITEKLVIKKGIVTAITTLNKQDKSVCPNAAN